MGSLTQVQTEPVTTATHSIGSVQLKVEEDSSMSSPDLAEIIPLPPPSREPSEVLNIDKNTPDGHVPRDPRLLRLTGAHPFNCFLTPPELHFVRNHGPVPHVQDDDIPDWELSIEGLVERPVVWTFQQILDEFEQITAPVTLVCAGNRRKEQNQVRKTKGFSWGSAGISTSLYTGPLMGDILRRAKPLRRAKYPNGHYGTSIKLNWALDFNRGIMLAHKMNGEPLRPDHGRPLRVVVPGQIGGRSVKWLKRLILTDSPSTNWYHINDNRLLPTMVSPEMASEDPKWWRDDRYAIFDLNVNSSVVYPENNEELVIASAPSTYTVKGYAYSGGGRRITRVEISLDKGRSWHLAHIDYAEDKYRNFEGDLFGGKVDMYWRETCFCWSFWSLDIPVSDLQASDAILVRAMDESLAVQPRDMYWSVLGMMNNPWFRVTITNENGRLKFEHPTHPTKTGGWMERVKKAGGDLANGYWGETVQGEAPAQQESAKEINMRREGLSRLIELQELKDHVSNGEPWFIVNGEVYDGTEFLRDHPGGAQSIISSAGMDVSEEFLAIHSETARIMMPGYHIGTLSTSALAVLQDNGLEEQNNSTEPRKTFLQSRYWSKTTLVRKKIVSSDSRIFTFELEHPKQTLGLPVGRHLMIRVPDPTKKNECIIRSYTPISGITQEGTMDILVKVYFDTATQPGGKMTTALDRLPLGSTIDCKGPTGRFEYLGNGNILIGDQERHVKSFRMICGGSGVTPIFQVLRAVMQDPDDPTTCVVLNGNRREEDILCRAELDALVALNNAKCTMIHTLTKAPETWAGHRGRISETLLKEYAMLNDDCMVLVCGPESMERDVQKILLGLGWEESNLHFF
ncbi:hypothetical protein MPDQ_003840 [Monascus purpureus]|uniref:Nitrate reductase [NADPH] n=1 Tax=Monascus purpureus TaxID=5098 RepID=A0A507R228_MONPU|nr:hypothetical protein MPDQ_003840 [Monascus purpureus]